MRPENRERNHRDPSNSRRAPRRQHGPSTIPLPHDCIRRNTRDCLARTSPPHPQGYDCQQQQHDQGQNLQSYSRCVHVKDTHFNASTSTMVHFHLVREKTSNVVWNSSSTTLVGLV